MSSVCPECGKKFPDGATSCNWCKPESEAYARPGYVCPTCGITLPDDRQCPYCVPAQNPEPIAATRQTSIFVSLCSVLGAILAVLLALLTWGFVFGFARGNPLGIVGALELVIFWSPIAFAIAPGIVRLIEVDSRVGVLWAIALAPIVGVLNVIPYFFFFSIAGLIFGKESQGPELIGAFLSSVIWLLLHFVYQDSRLSGQGRDSGIHTLRKPTRY